MFILCWILGMVFSSSESWEVEEVLEWKDGIVGDVDWDVDVGEVGELGGVFMFLKSFAARSSCIHFPEPVAVREEIFTGWK